jgi:hypothetical protein
VAGNEFFPKNKLITDFSDVPAKIKNLQALKSLQGYTLNDIRNFHVLILGNDRQLKDIKNVAKCIQFAHSFTGSG